MESVEVAARVKLLGHDQNPVARQTGTNMPQQRQPVLGREELQDIVQDHYLRTVNFDLANIGFHPLDAVVELGQTAGLLEHRACIVHRDHLAPRCSDSAQHGKRRRTERTAEVVAAPAFGEVPGR